MNYVFVFTFIVTLVAGLRFISLLFGNNVTLPKLIPGTAIDPSYYYVFYPSLMHQAYFWFERAGVIV